MFGRVEDFEDRREGMVDRLARAGRVERDSTTEAMATVPRHEFVPEPHRDDAYADRPLPIGDDQTISAPNMVAIMLDLLELEPGEEVLEVGTGRGYHAAVTAEVVGPDHVYSVEYSPDLAERARERFDEIGYDAIDVRTGDGHEGWPGRAPFDAIYLTCAASEIPDALFEQVRDDGRVLAPIGDRIQELVLARKREGDTIKRERHGGVRFVPMRGGDR